MSALIPPAFIIVWGELSEFDVNLSFLPTVAVPPVYLNLEQLAIGFYYLLTPSLILAFLRGLTPFRENDRRFVVVIIATIFSFGLLRYQEFIYDANGPPLVDPFGNFYPLAFWSLPLIMTASAAFFLSILP
jgi:hypothetical protein